MSHPQCSLRFSLELGTTPPPSEIFPARCSPGMSARRWPCPPRLSCLVKLLLPRAGSALGSRSVFLCSLLSLDGIFSPFSLVCVRAFFYCQILILHNQMTKKSQGYKNGGHSETPRALHTAAVLSACVCTSDLNVGIHPMKIPLINPRGITLANSYLHGVFHGLYHHMFLGLLSH